MHKNEIRYLSDDDLREVFKECTKRLFERDIKPLVLVDYCIPYDNSAITQLKGVKIMSQMIGEKCIVHKEFKSTEDLQGIACIK